MSKLTKRRLSKGSKQIVRKLLLQLPAELTKVILMYLDKKSFLLARATCTKFSLASNYLWDRLYYRTFKVCHSKTIPPYSAKIESFFSSEYNNNYNSLSSSASSSLSSSPRDLQLSSSPSSPKRTSGESSFSSLVSATFVSVPWRELFFERHKILNLKTSHFKHKKVFKKKSDVYYVDKGYAEIYRNNLEKALKCFEKALRIKRSARAYEGLARIYRQKDVPSFVIIFSEAGLEYNDVNQAELYYLRGKALLNFHRLEEAVKDLTKSIEYLQLSPVHHYLFLNITDVYYDRMLIHLELGNYNAAYSDCEKITQTDRYFEGGDCWLKCAKILYDKRMFLDAEKFLKKAKSKSKDYYLLYLQVEYSLAKYEKALECYRSLQQVYLEQLEAEQADEEQFISVGGAPARSTTSPPEIVIIPNESHDLYLEIGIILFMNHHLAEAIENYIHSIKILYYNALHANASVQNVHDHIAKAKRQVIRAASRQLSEYTLYPYLNEGETEEVFPEVDDMEGTPNANGDQSPISITNMLDIHVAWSFYYYLTALIFLHKCTTNGNLSTLWKKKEQPSPHNRTPTLPTTTHSIFDLSTPHTRSTSAPTLRLPITKLRTLDSVVDFDVIDSKIMNDQVLPLAVMTSTDGLKVASINFTRCITLNPTLSEAFYHRALLQCFLLLDQFEYNTAALSLSLSPTTTSSPTTSNRSFGSDMMKRVKNNMKSNSASSSNSSSGSSTPTTPTSSSKLVEHRQIAQKIMITNLMREALNDINNAYTLVTMNFHVLQDHHQQAQEEKKQPTEENLLHTADKSGDLWVQPANAADLLLLHQIYIINILSVKAYVLHCLGRKHDSLLECEQAIQLFSLLEPATVRSLEEVLTTLKIKCFGLKAIITREKEDLQTAFELDRQHNKLLSFPLSNISDDLLSVIIFINISQLL